MELTKAETKQRMLENIADYTAQSPVHDAHGIRKVADDLNTSLNTLTIILTGVMGAGKTFYALNEAIPLSHLPTVHLLVFVGRKDDDTTVRANVDLLGCPIEFVDYDTAAEVNQELLEAKRCYNALRAQLEERGELENWEEAFDEEN
jgi:hypothetical protein